MAGENGAVSRRQGDAGDAQAAVSAQAEFRAAAAVLGVAVTVAEPLARHTTFRIGGPADLFAPINRIDLLERLAALAAQHGIPTTILGGGSNVLVNDAGVRGLVIANQTRRFGLGERQWAAIRGPFPSLPGASILIADSGVTLAGLARWAIKDGWSGLEWAVSVPGTVGGAVIGNAGAHGGQIADNLAWALVAYPDHGQQILTRDELEFEYRGSCLKRALALAAGEAGAAPPAKRPAVLAAGFALTPGDAVALTARADGFLARRRASQPVEPSAGSIFRNPPGDHAGRLIEAAGLKGYRIGGAQISTRHANFIINSGAARAADVTELMALIQAEVNRQFGVALRAEILLLGDWSASRES